jgi:hypothetical protein
MGQSNLSPREPGSAWGETDDGQLGPEFFSHAITISDDLRLMA